MKTLLLTGLSFVLLLAVGETKAFTSIASATRRLPKHKQNIIMSPSTDTKSGDKTLQGTKSNDSHNSTTNNTAFQFKLLAGSIAGALSSIAPALASTACCWGPAVLSAIGASTATPMLSRISHYRPYLLGLSTTMISYSFYRAYGPPSKMEHACCQSEAQKKAHAKKLNINRAVVWASLAVAIYGASYGRVSLPFLTKTNLMAAPKNLWQATTAGGVAGLASSSNMLKFHVEGMSCGGCATKVRKAIEGIHGVNNVVVDQTTGLAIVKGVGVQANENIIKAAISKIGYGVGP